MTKTTLKTADEYHRWTADMIDRGFYLGPDTTPPSFPCIMIWTEGEGRRDRIRAQFVEPRDFPAE